MRIDYKIKSVRVAFDRTIVGVSDLDKATENTKMSENPATEPPYEPYKGKKRKSGTGYVKQLTKNCWQGRYTPTIYGKRKAMNVYGKTEKECEMKLKELIESVKAERGG